MAVKISRILFPTDFSDVAMDAASMAAEMARVFDAELHCIHVIDEAYQYWSSMGPESIPVGPPVEELIDLGKTRMQKFLRQQFADLKKPVVSSVVMGRPFAEIIKYARDQKIDLTVMGTHGRGALAHVLLGSTTEKVVRKSPCAVLTVRHGGHTFVMP